MCGIFLSVSLEGYIKPSEEHLQRLKNRGPDSFKIITRQLDTGSKEPVEHCTFYLTFVATVLSLRGDRLVDQPLQDSRTGSLLCWNGEAWKLGGSIVEGNDAQAVFNLLLEAVQLAEHEKSTLESCVAIEKSLSSVAGPFAFVFYDAINKRLFYGRDVLGRRSLVITQDANQSLLVASIGEDTFTDSWVEVEADGLYSLNLGARFECTSEIADAQRYKSSILNHVEHIPWSARNQIPHTSLAYPFPPLNKGVPAAIPANLRLGSPIVTELAQHLSNAVSDRVLNVRALPATLAIAPRIAILFSGGVDCSLLARVLHGILPRDQEVDLLNVAFENPRVVEAEKAASRVDKSFDPYSICPDRVTGLSSYEELISLCHDRKWRFVSINIPYLETIQHRPQIVSLIHPHNTEMDLSIACALYFAARGNGTILDSNRGPATPYATPARVLISGLGADELFGGYNRHATAFARKGYQGLVDELELDFSRLGKRNLGRDDRVISHWAKEVRYPYLDEDIVSWAMGLPAWEKCGFPGSRSPNQVSEDLDTSIIEPGKKVLRLLAWQLGLKGCAVQKKRAIQFGARTAKMERGTRKGTQLI